MEIKNPTARQMIPVMIESTVTCGKVPSADDRNGGGYHQSDNSPVSIQRELYKDNFDHALQ